MLSSILKTAFLKLLGYKGILGRYPEPRLQNIRQAKEGSAQLPLALLTRPKIRLQIFTLRPAID